MAKFEKGKSGNPKGRPKQLIEVVEAFRDHTDAAKDKLIALMGNRSPRIALAAAKEILNRGWGMPVQATDLVFHSETHNALTAGSAREQLTDRIRSLADRMRAFGELPPDHESENTNGGNLHS